MSGCGSTFRTYVAKLTMSAHGGKSDLIVTGADFRNWPRADIGDYQRYFAGPPPTSSRHRV